MATELRPVNPSELPPPRGFSQSMPWGDLVILSVQLPLNEHGMLVSEDFDAQCQQVFRNIDVALTSQGGALKDLLKITVFLTSLENYEPFRDVREQMLEEPFPTSTLIGVTGLAVVGALISIEGLAARR
jgi:2-iminobutanoate/2-iminopropanoate deaminase